MDTKNLNVSIPSQPECPYLEAKKMYEENQEKLEDFADFDDTIRNTLFFAFTGDNNELLGLIYYYTLDDGLTYINGVAGKKHHLTNLRGLKWTLNGFNCDIYARSKQKPAILCLLRLGFKKIDKNLYKLERTK